MLALTVAATVSAHPLGNFTINHYAGIVVAASEIRLDFVLDQAEAWHRQHLGRLYALWDTWNAAYFAGQLVPPYVLLTPPESPRALGDCASISSFGGRCQIRVRPSLLLGTHPLGVN